MKCIKWILIAVVVYVFGLGLLVPLFGMEKGEGSLTVSGIKSADSGGERIYCIDDNLEALTMRLEVIAAAENSIDLSTLDLRDDISGTAVMSALYDAAERGVSVRIVLDGLTSGTHLYTSGTFRALIASENVTARYYNRLNLLTPWKLNYRLHDKYMVVDGELYILGGRNIHDLFLGDYVDTYNIDRDVLVYGGATTKELSDYFEEMWYSRELSDINYHITERALEKRTEELVSTWEEFSEKYGIGENWDIEAVTYPVNSVTLLANPTNTGAKEPVIWGELMSLIASSDEVKIETPYIILDSDRLSEMAETIESCGNVTFYTNSVETGVNLFGCGNYLLSKDKILGTGASVTEWVGYQSLHGKALVLDDDICVVGTFNFDMRSVYLDTEIMLIIDSPELAEQLNSQLSMMEREGRTVSPDGETVYGSELLEVSYPLTKRVKHTVVGVLEAPFRYLL